MAVWHTYVLTTVATITTRLSREEPHGRMPVICRGIVFYHDMELCLARVCSAPFTTSPKQSLASGHEEARTKYLRAEMGDAIGLKNSGYIASTTSIVGALAWWRQLSAHIGIGWRQL